MPQNYEKRESYSSFTKWHWSLLGVFLLGSIFLVQLNATDFQVSVITTQTPPAYDGTALPVKMAPKWASLASGEWDLGYQQMPANKMQPLPTYDPAQLKASTATLGWTNEADLAIRNAKITFSVPYMGNYKLDGQEYVGSHLAVDLKLPRETPVYAIGNGVVTKVSEQSTGFGNHIVIKHENFPSLNNPSAKETYYSSYSHLGQISIGEGSVVLRGQQIGKSGDTGTATTPHVHFQIDNVNAPWHPYWPFTFQEASEAGLSFHEAVNAGLGKDKALETTIHPMLYVQKYLSSGAIETTPSTPPSSVPSDPSGTELPPSVDGSNPDTGENNILEPEVVEPVVVVKPAVSFELQHPDIFTVGNTETIQVTALDEDGEVVQDYQPPHDLYVKLLAGGAELPDKVSARGFSRGVAQFTITPTANIGLQIEVTDNDISGQSRIMQSIMFHDVTEDADYFEAVNFLKENDVIGGYPDGTFRPDTVVSRVEALKFILKGMNSELLTSNELPFPDTAAQEWYSDYVATAYNREIVRGYPDNTFKPANTVNRAEFLKMLLTSMDLEVDMNVSRDVYKDVLRDAWYAPYVQYAKEKNLIILRDRLFKPEEGMTRAEVAELIYRVILLKVSGMDRYSSGIRVSEGDVTAFFS